MWNKPIVLSLEDAILVSNNLKYSKKLGVTTGCFDIFHSGHLKSIKFSKKNCDILFLLLNSDISIKKLKGENRPINKLELRIDLLKELPYIDYIIVFDDKDADDIIRKLNCDILFKGGDYKKEHLKEKFPSMDIILSDLVSDLSGNANSTSNIIKRIL